MVAESEAVIRLRQIGIDGDARGDGKEDPPEGRHPIIEVICAETLDVESRTTRINVNIFPTTS